MRLTEKVHQILTTHLKDGDLAIDATAGNGHDTQYLATKVAPSGKVFAIDIQAAAIDATRRRLSEAQVSELVELRMGDHREILEGLSATKSGLISAIIFNLGYLPGSDHSIQTRTEHTLPALESSLKLLKIGGLLCVTAYRGHSGGMEEARSVEKWMHQKSDSGHKIESFIPESQNNPPILWVLHKC